MPNQRGRSDLKRLNMAPYGLFFKIIRNGYRYAPAPKHPAQAGRSTTNLVRYDIRGDLSSCRSTHDHDSVWLKVGRGVRLNHIIYFIQSVTPTPYQFFEVTPKHASILELPHESFSCSSSVQRSIKVSTLSRSLPQRAASIAAMVTAFGAFNSIGSILSTVPQVNSKRMASDTDKPIDARIDLASAFKRSSMRARTTVAVMLTSLNVAT